MVLLHPRPRPFFVALLALTSLLAACAGRGDLPTQATNTVGATGVAQGPTTLSTVTPSPTTQPTGETTRWVVSPPASTPSATASPTLASASSTPPVATATLLPVASATLEAFGAPAAAPLDLHAQLLHPDLARPDLAVLPYYVISATLATPVLAGQLWLSVPNDGATPLPDIVLRLYGNGATIYTGARMEATNARVNGQPVAALPEAQGTALRLPLPTPLAPGQRATVSLDFRTEVATGSFRGYGIQQQAQGIAVFGSPFPLLALRDGATWRVPGVPAVGDAASSPTALWDLFLDVPSDLTLVSTGEPLATGDGRTHIASGPARDVALVALPAGQQPIESVIAGTRLRYWPARYVASETFPAADAAAVAARAVEIFTREFGPPPYATLDVVEAQVPIGGYEYPGLVLFDGQRRAQADRDGIDFLVPHEVAHQWFYALLGNDVTREPWIDEGLATFAQLRYLYRLRGPEAAAAQRAGWAAEYAGALARRPVGVNRALFGYGDWVSYRGPTYYASALLFDDLRLRLGDAAFSEALRRLLARHAFREATTADVRAAFDEVAGEAGMGLADFWAQWLEP